MVFDPKIYRTGPDRFLLTSAIRYETVWESGAVVAPKSDQKERKNTATQCTPFYSFPCIAAIFWDWNSNQYLQLTALNDDSYSFNRHNVDLTGGCGGFTDETRINCILESIAINPLTPAVVWKHRQNKHNIFAQEIHSTCPSILPPLCTLIASFTF
jgi:hypothetical protein